ncbi:helix-turn-helix transcriptional regulator [Planomicrobium okeanokoites]|uniref:helix-turn-helix transcriptional regulator n=1 Tax=Planomicrobium okeanokoites TaxID=244 RepID=UPI000A02A2AC|nr:helix-turn-helix transcriptional regulator [Planomicrobium okeanokoites]
MKNFKLIEARKEKGMTQEKLAKYLGYKGKQSVANWENNHISPPLNTAIRISQILGKDISFLFGEYIQETHTKEGSAI